MCVCSPDFTGTCGIHPGKEPVSVKFPFRPLNGYIMITSDPGDSDPARGTVIAVCRSLESQIFPGDFVMYDPHTELVPLSFGPARGGLINVSQIYGFWDKDEVHRIEAATQGRPGVLGRAIEFEL